MQVIAYLVAAALAAGVVYAIYRFASSSSSSGTTVGGSVSPPKPKPGPPQ